MRRSDLIKEAELSQQAKVAKWIARLRRECGQQDACKEAIDGLLADRRKLQHKICRLSGNLEDLRDRIQQSVGRYKFNKAKPGDKPSNTLTPYAQSLVDRLTEEENEKKAGEGLYVDPSRVNCNQHIF